MSLCYLDFVLYVVNAVFCFSFFFFQFLNEWPSRFARLAILPPVAEMNPRQRHALDVYLNDCKDLFAEWQEFKGQDPS